MTYLTWDDNKELPTTGYLGAWMVFAVHVSEDEQGMHLVSRLPGEAYHGHYFGGHSLAAAKLMAEARTHQWLAKAGLKPM